MNRLRIWCLWVLRQKSSARCSPATTSSSSSPRCVSLAESSARTGAGRPRKKQPARARMAGRA